MKKEYYEAYEDRYQDVYKKIYYGRHRSQVKI